MRHVNQTTSQVTRYAFQCGILRLYRTSVMEDETWSTFDLRMNSRNWRSNDGAPSGFDKPRSSNGRNLVQGMTPRGRALDAV